MSHTRTRWLRIALQLLVLMAATVLVVGPVFAQPIADKKRWTARKLGGEGIDLYEAGDYAGALEKFTAADELVPAPTVKLYAARCLDKLDRMLEAAAIYRDTIEFELDRRSPEVHRKARKDAIKELATLLESIPTVEVIVTGPGAADATVELDGRTLAVEDLGKKLQVDPGAHALKATRASDDEVVQQTVVAQRGTPLQVTLELPDPDSPDDTVVVREQGDPNLGDGWRAGGWATLAVSGAVLVAGTIVGIVVLDQAGTLEDECPDRQCPPDKQDDVESLDTLRAVSSVGIITGVAGVTSAVLMLVLAPTAGDAEGPGSRELDDDTVSVDVGLAAGPRSLGVSLSGRF